MTNKSPDTKKFDEEQERFTLLERKLESLRDRLTDDLNIDELKKLQVHTDLLENILTAAVNYHHHDTNQHHDHETKFGSELIPEGEVQRRKY